MCNLELAQEIIEKDPNGKDLTEENYQEVLTLLTSEIKALHQTILTTRYS